MATRGFSLFYSFINRWVQEKGEGEAHPQLFFPPPPRLTHVSAVRIRNSYSREKPIIAFPAIPVILNQAGVLMNRSLPQDGGHCFYSTPSSVIYLQVSQPYLCFNRRGQHEACIPMNHLQLSPPSCRGPVLQSHCCAIRPFSSGILPNTAGLINMNPWMFNCGLYLHDQFTTMCPLIWGNCCWWKRTRIFFIGNKPWHRSHIECCVIVCDAWVGFITN